MAVQMAVGNALADVNKRSILFTVICLGICILTEVGYAIYFRGSLEAYDVYVLYREPLKLAWMAVVMFSLFFVFGKSRFAVNPKSGFQIASILLIILAVFCAAMVIANVRLMPAIDVDSYTVEGFMKLFRYMERRGEIMRTFSEYEGVFGLALFFLLWINTSPKKKEA